MKPLLTLRCPKGCLLGSVVVVDAEAMVVMRERAEVHAADSSTWQVQHVGPYPLSEPVSYGCRHVTDVVDAQTRALLVRKVEQVRRAERPAGQRHTLRPATGIVN